MRSVLGHCIIILIFGSFVIQIINSVLTEYDNDDKKFVNTETTLVFYFSNFPLLVTALALTQTYGNFREPVHKTPVLLICFIIQILVTIIMTVVPSNFIKDLLYKNG